MPRKIDLSACKVRLATSSDKEGITRMSRGIWGGTDYLPKILDKWLADPYFFVCEYETKIIGCGKISVFPDKVLWFEGLRVHHSYQGQGVAKLINRHMMAFAADLESRAGKHSHEFCTYYRNYESLHLAKLRGFKVIKRFYDLNKRGISRQIAPELIDIQDMSCFSAYPDYLPCGWQVFHNHPSALQIIKERGKVFKTPQGLYYAGGLAEIHILPLNPLPLDLKAELPYFQWFYPQRRSIGLIVPFGYRRKMHLLREAGFAPWDHEPKPAANMLLLKL